MTITTLLFDLGGVVCRFTPEARLAVLAADCGLPPAEVRARIWDSTFDADCDLGRYTAAEIHAEVRRRIGLRMDETAFRDAWASAFTPDPDLLTLIDALPARIGAALLTDNGPVLRDALPVLFPEVARRLDPLLFSCDLGARKPSPEIFTRALVRLGEPAARVLFVDDTIAAVEGARRAGITAIHYTDAATLRTDLRAIAGEFDDAP